MTTLGQDTKGLVGRNHPDTSEAAADTVLTGRSRVIVLDTLRAAGDFGEIQEWISRITRLPGDTVRPRLRELAKMGFVVQTDRKRRTESGKDARVWQITATGADALARYAAEHGIPD